jgi:hypothetical protein
MRGPEQNGEPTCLASSHVHCTYLAVALTADRFSAQPSGRWVCPVCRDDKQTKPTILRTRKAGDEAQHGVSSTAYNVLSSSSLRPTAPAAVAELAVSIGDSMNSITVPVSTSESVEGSRNAINTSSSGTAVDGYCICGRGFDGDMVACEAEGCMVEWYHFGCVGLTVAPPPGDEWVCPACRGERFGQPVTQRRQRKGKPSTKKQRRAPSSKSAAHVS